MSGRFAIHLAGVLSSAIFAISGCTTIAAIEPVANPPAGFQSDVAVQAEFLDPARVGPRCADRGVRVFGVPAVNAMACANARLITMPNPCDTVSGGWYAQALCAEIGHSQGWAPEDASPSPSDTGVGSVPSAERGFRPDAERRADTAIRVEFVDRTLVSSRCAQRGATYFGQPALDALSCSNAAMITAPNPCSVIDGGWYARLLCHELGHANGWPQSHAGGSFLRNDQVSGQPSLPADGEDLVARLAGAIAAAAANARRDDPVRATIVAALTRDGTRAAEIRQAVGIVDEAVSGPLLVGQLTVTPPATVLPVGPRSKTDGTRAHAG
jgi:hypothetical protein